MFNAGIAYISVGLIVSLIMIRLKWRKQFAKYPTAQRWLMYLILSLFWPLVMVRGWYKGESGE